MDAITYDEAVAVRDAIATQFAWFIDQPKYGPKVAEDWDGPGEHLISWEEGSPTSWTNAVPAGGVVLYGADHPKRVPPITLPEGLRVEAYDHISVRVYRATGTRPEPVPLCVLCAKHNAEHAVEDRLVLCPACFHGMDMTSLQAWDTLEQAMDEL